MKDHNKKCPKCEDENIIFIYSLSETEDYIPGRDISGSERVSVLECRVCKGSFHLKR